MSQDALQVRPAWGSVWMSRAEVGCWVSPWAATIELGPLALVLQDSHICAAYIGDADLSSPFEATAVLARVRGMNSASSRLKCKSPKPALDAAQTTCPTCSRAGQNWAFRS